MEETDGGVLTVRTYFRRLRYFWFRDWAALAWLLLGLPALYFWQTVVHEGSHAVTAWVGDGRWPKLAPFPHLTADGRFLNGVTFSAGGFIATPQFVDLALIVLFALVFLFWPLRSALARYVLRWWYLGACVDLLYNTSRELIGGHNRFADWSRFQDRFSIPDAAMIALTVAIWLLVWSHFAWVHVAAWSRVPVRETARPAERWIALFLGLLSLAAVIVSLAVRDNRIVKSSAAFIVPLAVQAAALAWHAGYVIWTGRK